MRSRRSVLFILFLLAVTATTLWWFAPQLFRPTERLVLTPVAFRDLPGWSAANLARALAAFKASCLRLRILIPTTPMGSYAGHASDWQPACAAAEATASPQARHFFESQFHAFQISDDALFTGYYEPLLRGSRTRHGRYQTPIYALPPDLISVDLGKFRPELAGERIAGRVEGQKLVPYATRAEIAVKPPNTATLVYADDPVSVFFLHIQGSGRVLLDDGTTIRVAYAGQNGQLYTPIGRVMLQEGLLDKGELSMQSIRNWLRAHPTEGKKVMEKDASFIFFAEHPLGDPERGSAGTEGVPLTPRASIAVDTRLHALGSPFFLSAATPDGKVMQELMIAQDTGGAIRGPARADIFFGFGREAETLAGGMKATGAFYVLLPNSLTPKPAP